MTYARLATYQADPSKLEDSIRFAREQGIAIFRQQPGFQGVLLLVDRQSGKTIGVTLWESEAAQAAAAAGAVSQSRDQFAERLVGHLS